MDIHRLLESRWRPEPWQEIAGFRRVAALLLILIQMGAVVALVLRTGGTATAYLNFILIPILAGAAVFGPRGGAILGLLAGLALGPFMPMDTTTGQMQPLLNWTTRMGLYVFLGGATGWMFAQLHGHARQLVNQALTNPVTGLPNRQALENDLRERLATARAEPGPGSGSVTRVASLRMDNYEDTISALGLEAEHPLLRAIAERLQISARLGNGRLYHIHDDHFVLVLEGNGEPPCQAITGQAVERLQTPFELHGIPVYLGAHAGVATFPDGEDDDPGRLLTRAWMAMHEARTSGHTCRQWNPRQDERSRRTVARLGELQEALGRDQLHLWYQPKTDPGDGRLLGVEGLLRWEHPRHGLVPPDEFIPQAEQTGLIHPLTRELLECAAADTRRLREAGIDIPVSVNVSARNFIDPEFAEHVLAIIERAGLQPGDLELEFTESAVMANPEEVVTALDHLEAAGVALAIDDFGTGQASLAYLRRLPVHSLKIDQAFVREMAHQRVDGQITRAAIGLGHDLGLQVVAEGVEDEGTLSELHQLGCDAVQGYGIARPMPLDDVIRWTHANSPPAPAPAT
ncbi:bifunctional diguanylate cyclase/phosphodiesterase [Thioalkalivibrio sp. ALE19]|uniref:putative bifunctional diguanylate cyclase/phosphodiesterase n=1 Tax=Thioalkalivibrio sp. ALE19 TaxID=1266909 RepID=UPI00041AFEB7|nr:phosphodiesterase [Thioalkalivibrio sp. ALE19]